MNVLFIDTSSNKKVSVGVKIDGNLIRIEKEIGVNKAQDILPILDNLLIQNNLSINNINSIQIELGPGSYTGLRVGISIANTLSYLLKIPINGHPVGTFVEPVYS